MHELLNELPHELRNDLRVEFDGKYPAGHPKPKFWHFSAKNRKKLAVEHFIGKPVLLNFVNLSKTVVNGKLILMSIVTILSLMFASKSILRNISEFLP